MRSRAVLLLTVVAVLGVAADPVSAARARPDLAVSSGKVAAASGRLTGRFVVADSGRRRAGASKASLALRDAKGKDHVLGRFAVPALRASRRATVKVSLALPQLAAGRYTVRVCADSAKRVTERSESNNCRSVGALDVPGATTAGPPPATAPTSTQPTPTTSTTPTTTPTPAPPPSTVPTAPMSFPPNASAHLRSGGSDYWVDVPPAYDATHKTPSSLLVWLHGCGGESSGDIETVSPAGRSYVAIAVGGREDDCWDPAADQAKVFAAIADVETHLNIDRRRIVLGGYSSGGDLAYRTIFEHALSFAGILAENTSPFRDTGRSQADLLGAAAWKFHAVHLAHTGDKTYPIDGVRKETDAMVAAGFPLTRVERPGTHYDDPGAVPGTDADLRTYLLAHMDDGWLAPATG